MCESNKNFSEQVDDLWSFSAFPFHRLKFTVPFAEKNHIFILFSPLLIYAAIKNVFDVPSLDMKFRFLAWMEKKSFPFHREILGISNRKFCAKWKVSQTSHLFDPCPHLTVVVSLYRLHSEHCFLHSYDNQTLKIVIQDMEMTAKELRWKVMKVTLSHV